MGPRTRGLRRRGGRGRRAGRERSLSLSKLRAGIAKRTGGDAGNFGALDVEVREEFSSVVLEGRVPDWRLKVELGWFAAGFGYKGVVNDLEVEGIEEERLAPSFPAGDRPLEGRSFDVAIIGGGVVGCAIARELAKWKVSAVLLEKEEDVAAHTSSRNDGMIHDGFAARPGTRKAAYNVRGNRLWEPLAGELRIDFSRPGSLVVFGSSAAKAAYPIMAARAKENGVDGWEFWSRKRLLAEEPNVTDGQHGAFFLPSAGIVSPYRATVALAESAAANGVEFSLGTCALGLEKEGGRITRVLTNRGDFRAAVVVNAAGNWSDAVAGMAGDRFFSLHQRRGVEMILDANAGRHLNHIMAMPSLLTVNRKTKGGGLVKTVEGNVLVGPTAAEAPGRENYATTAAELRELEKHLRLNKKLSPSMVITYFAGVRACTYEEDFIVERSERVPNLVHAAGIQSPGLASAPAVAEDVVRLALEALAATKRVSRNAAFVAARRAAPELRRLPFAERAALIAKNPAYGRIVCRCEEVSEGEIRDALRSPLPAASLDAVKRRARPGMGRCHGGFCTPRVMEIVADELGIPLDEVTKKGPGSRIACGQTKAGAEGGRQ
ncbi:MAG: NAD(P)/FAD-dependent oxidoreductase [Spirochaetaceae bacterium]|nr:NAD(P)/FAD-dependent oxidoreductase [Spirochaetaceae bacterium]